MSAPALLRWPVARLAAFLDAVEVLGLDERAQYAAFERTLGPWPPDLDERGKTALLKRVWAHPWVSSEAQRRRVQAQTKAGVSATRVLQELAAIAFADPRRIATRVKDAATGQEASRMLDLDELPDDIAVAVSSWKQGAHGPEVKFWDKPAALRALGEITGLLHSSRPGATEQASPALGVTAQDLDDDELALLLLEADGPAQDASVVAVTQLTGVVALDATDAVEQAPLFDGDV